MSKRSDVWKSSETSQLPRLLAALEQIYADKTAASLKIDVHVCYSVHIARSSFAEARRSCLASYECTVLDMCQLEPPKWKWKVTTFV